MCIRVAVGMQCVSAGASHTFVANLPQQPQNNNHGKCWAGSIISPKISGSLPGPSFYCYCEILRKSQTSTIVFSRISKHLIVLMYGNSCTGSSTSEFNLVFVCVFQSPVNHKCVACPMEEKKTVFYSKYLCWTENLWLTLCSFDF